MINDKKIKKNQEAESDASWFFCFLYFAAAAWWLL